MGGLGHSGGGGENRGKEKKKQVKKKENVIRKKERTNIGEVREGKSLGKEGKVNDKKREGGKIEEKS